MIDSEILKISVPPEEDIMLDGRIRMREVFIKVKNEIWIFHKNDKDSFPSKPHGHNQETGEKLNVYTGEIIDKCRNFSPKMKSKQLKYVQSRLRSAGFELSIE